MTYAISDSPSAVMKRSFVHPRIPEQTAGSYPESGHGPERQYQRTSFPYNLHNTIFNPCKITKNKPSNHIF